MKRWIKCLSCIALAITTACGGQPKTLMLAEAPPDLLDLRSTRYGRYLYAVGGKAEAAYQTAVPVRRMIFSLRIPAAIPMPPCSCSP